MIRLVGSGAELARMMGCSKSYVSKWPEVLPQKIADRIVGALLRCGIDPAPLLDAEQQEAA